MTDTSRSAFRIWRLALSVFILSGLTGLLFRVAGLTPGLVGLGLANIRHAHSHTMFFGWVTPALMLFIGRYLERQRGQPLVRLERIISAVFVTAALSYPAFLLFGYASWQIGSLSLPISVIASGLNILMWYLFVLAYVHARDDLESTLSVRSFDLAVFFLVGASLGAWGLPIVQFAAPDSILLKSALTHLFLDLFSEGWLTLGVLGLAAATVPEPDARSTWGLRLAGLGIPFVFALGMPSSQVSDMFQALSNAAGVALSVGLLLIVSRFWSVRRGLLWRFALAALAVKAFVLAVAIILPGWSWVSYPIFRILYIHLGLLGFATVGLIAASADTFHEGRIRGRRMLVASVLALLISLILLTPIWPTQWWGNWIVYVAAAASALPVIAIGYMLAMSRGATTRLPDQP